MSSTFRKLNDVGIEVKYTIIAYYDKNYVIYTNYMPANNFMGIRLFAGKVESDNPLVVVDISKKEEKEILDNFKMQVLQVSSK